MLISQLRNDGPIWPLLKHLQQTLDIWLGNMMGWWFSNVWWDSNELYWGRIFNTIWNCLNESMTLRWGKIPIDFWPTKIEHNFVGFLQRFSKLIYFRIFLAKKEILKTLTDLFHHDLPSYIHIFVPKQHS